MSGKGILTKYNFSDNGWDGDDYTINRKDRNKWVTRVDKDRGVFYTPFYITMDKHGNASIDKKIVKDRINKLMKLL